MEIPFFPHQTPVKQRDLWGKDYLNLIDDKGKTLAYNGEYYEEILTRERKHTDTKAGGWCKPVRFN